MEKTGKSCKTCRLYTQCGGFVCMCGATCWGNPAHKVWEMVDEGNHFPHPEMYPPPEGYCSAWEKESP